MKSFFRSSKNTFLNAWSWVPSLYFAEGIPYVIIMTVSVIMYKRLGISNFEISLYTSWLYLPWIIKPLWSPFIEVLATKKYWIILMQFLIGSSLAMISFFLTDDNFLSITLSFFWLAAFSSATHDIAADGFYMIALSEKKQSFFVGIRSTFYKIAMIVGQGALIIIAANLENSSTLFDSDVSQLLNSEKSLSMNSHFYININEEDFNPMDKDEITEKVKQFREQNFTNRFVTTFSEENLTVGKEVKFYKFSFNSVQSIENLLLEIISDSEDVKIIAGSTLYYQNQNSSAAYIAISSNNNVDLSEIRIKGIMINHAWQNVFFIIAGLMIVLAIYHLIFLPAIEEKTGTNKIPILEKSFESFISFFKKDKIGIVILFMLFYRLGEAQLAKLAAPFLLDSSDMGGLGLSTFNIGFIYGTIGLSALILGGIIGGIVISKKGLKYWIWWMLIAINLPNIVYVFLSWSHPDSLSIITTCVAIEQFGYGFGFTAYIMYMIYISKGKYKTTHYAICTGFMALGMMLPGLISGYLQELMGYNLFFIWVLLSTIPIFLITKYLPLQSDFGLKGD